MALHKAYFAMRTDLGMSEAKLAVQVGHGTDLIHENAGLCPNYAAWKGGEDGNDRRRVVCRVGGEAELRRIAARLDAAGLPWAEILDNGHTEFGGKRTLTGIVVLPVPEGPARTAGLHRLQAWRDRRIPVSADGEARPGPGCVPQGKASLIAR